MRLEPQPAMPMSVPASAAADVEHARRARAGLWLGLLGMLIFAGTIPMTRLASGSNEAPQLSPVFVAIGRAGVAGLLSLAYLLVTRAPWPRRAHWPMLALSALGNVLGWPLLLGLAVRRVDAMHASVITGLMPLATAAVASGIKPVMTDACIASTRRTARPSSSGQPSTLPSADMNSIGQCDLRGHGARVTSR